MMLRSGRAPACSLLTINRRDCHDTHTHHCGRAYGGGAAFAADPAQHLCGWVENPTPANWTLTDKSAQWIIGVQGGHQATGALFDFPKGKKFWVNTQPNGYGYGCGCLDATVDAAKHEVAVIAKAKVQKLSVCRKDKALKEPK